MFTFYNIYRPLYFPSSSCAIDPRLQTECILNFPNACVNCRRVTSELVKMDISGKHLFPGFPFSSYLSPWHFLLFLLALQQSPASTVTTPFFVSRFLHVRALSLALSSLFSVCVLPAKQSLKKKYVFPIFKFFTVLDTMCCLR